METLFDSAPAFPVDAAKKGSRVVGGSNLSVI
jgi:hypothetical protein